MSRAAFGLVAISLLILTLALFSPILPAGDLGLCLPSPNQWKIPRFGAWLIDSMLVVASAAVMAAGNKKYNFIPEATPIMPLAIMLLVACNPVTTATLSTSTLLLFINVLSLFIIISTYEEPNATREFFILGTLPAIGAMFQYSFLVMIPVYIGGGLLMKSFRIREFIAFVFGLIAPYWIAIGLGIVSPFSFRLPETLQIFNRKAVESDIFLTLMGAGIMALVGFILSLYNAVRLFSRNSRLRCMHMAFNAMGYVAVLAVIFDFTNFVAYFGTLALWLSIELATMLHFYNIRRPQLALVILLAVFLPLYLIAI